MIAALNQINMSFPDLFIANLKIEIKVISQQLFVWQLPTEL